MRPTPLPWISAGLRAGLTAGIVFLLSPLPGRGATPPYPLEAGSAQLVQTFEQWLRERGGGSSDLGPEVDEFSSGVAGLGLEPGVPSDEGIVEGFRRQLSWFSPPGDASAASFALEHLVDVVYAKLPFRTEASASPAEHPKFPKKYAWLARQRLQYGRDLRVRQEPETALATTEGEAGSSPGQRFLENAYRGWLEKGRELEGSHVSEPMALNLPDSSRTSLLGMPPPGGTP